MSELLDVLSRLAHGEPAAEKRFTVYYWDSSWPSKVLKTLFGLRGCYRKDCDDFHFKWQPTGFGFAAMIDSNEKGRYIWVNQVENYVINFDYKKIVDEVEQDTYAAMKKAAKNEAIAKFEAIGGLQPPKDDMYHG